MKSLLFVSLLFRALTSLASQPLPRREICGVSGTRSGAVGRMIPWDEHRAGSSEPAQVLAEVVDIEGRPLPNASVWLQHGFARDPKARGAVTKGDGRVSLNRVAPGTFVLHVQRIGFQAQWQTLELLSGASDTLCLRLRAMPMAPPGLSLNGRGRR
jgi:hypothetical protein